MLYLKKFPKEEKFQKEISVILRPEVAIFDQIHYLLHYLKNHCQDPMFSLNCMKFMNPMFESHFPKQKFDIENLLHKVWKGEQRALFRKY